MGKAYVYHLHNTQEDGHYIGFTMQSPDKRYRQHLTNPANARLRDAIERTQGELTEVWRFEVLEAWESPIEALEREAELIQTYRDSGKLVYNHQARDALRLRLFGDGPVCLCCAASVPRRGYCEACLTSEWAKGLGDATEALDGPEDYFYPEAPLTLEDLVDEPESGPRPGEGLPEWFLESREPKRPRHSYQPLKLGFKRL